MKAREGPDDTEACYFITFNTVDWVDVFVRPVYKQVVVHTLNHFIDSKNLVVYGWSLMTHHLHLLASTEECNMTDLEKEFTTFTTHKILEAIDTEPAERRKWMLQRFENFATLLGLMKKYHVWQNCSTPLYIDFRKTDLLLEHFDLIHDNAVRDKVVDMPAEYLYSSARDYTGTKGIVNIKKIPAVEKYIAEAESTKGNFHVKYVHQ